VTPDDRDRELSRLFQAERLADESAAPRLDELFGRARPRRVRAGDALGRLALAAAVAGVIAAAAAVLRSGASVESAPAATPVAETVQLAEWRSPTAFLLDTPGSELLTEVPILSTAPLAESAGAAAPQPPKGVAQ
jgi:hypothetical protein